MKKTFLFFLITLAFGAPAKKASAIAYGAGGELIYQYINDSTYRFYYKFYRACTGIGENNEFSLCYRNTCSGIWYTEILQKAALSPFGTPNGQIVDNACANQPNACTDPNSTIEMYREWWYTGVVTLNEPCDHWIFSVNISERDRDYLTNLAILPPFQHNLYVEANIYTQTEPHQSSPYFTAPLPVYTCSGADFHYNPGVVDPDGDSLVYKMIQPRAATTDIFVLCAGYPPYNIPFAGTQYNLTDNPLETNNTFTLDATNGDMEFTPSGNQVAYLALLVEKYRNGQLIGSVMRDTRMEVHTCQSPPVQFSFNPNSVSGAALSGDTIVACGNTNVNFCFSGSSTDGSAVLKLSENSGRVMKGARVTYQNQGTDDVTGCVSWTPGLNDTGFRYFVVNIKDSGCAPGDYPVVQTFKIPVFVKTGTRAWAVDSLVCPGASAWLKADGGNNFFWNAFPGDPAASLSCSNCDSTLVTPSDNTRIIVTSDLANGCRNKDTVYIGVDRSNSVDITPPGPLVFCEGGGYVQFTASGNGPRPVKVVTCGPSSGLCGGNLDSVQIAETSNNSNMSDMMYIWVSYYGPFYSYFRTQKMQVLYRKEELKEVGMTPGTIKKIALNFGNFQGQNPTFSNVRISLRCSDKRQFTSLAQSEFELGLTQVFSAASVTLHPGWNEFEFDVPYDYDTSKNLVVQFCYSGVSPVSTQSTGNMLPVYYVTTSYKSSIAAGQVSAGNACSGSIGQIRTYQRRPDMRFVFCDMPETDFSYSWTPATGMDNPGGASTGINVDTSTWFTVTTKGRTGCEVKDSIYVYVADNHFSVQPDHAEICLGDAITLNAIGGVHSSTWYNDDFTGPDNFSCTTCNSPVVHPQDLGLYPYKVIMSDSFGCTDTADASVNVNPIAQVVITTPDTTIQYGQSVQLHATGAAYYMWSPTQTLDNPRLASPVASPLQSTRYTAKGYMPGGCSTEASVWVYVDAVGLVMIPNAFSPNGDGVNDVFRIENLVFQKVSSFLIFNRYGQVVYDGARNSNKGWDGTINGKPAPLGTYFYHIQLTYPDRKVKSYKGDITLIR